jgi:hypothetical protein
MDLGPTLAPHELVARALDPGGRELARARQWINMPRPPAEAEILLERDKARRATLARIAWQSLTGEQPVKVEVSFDGRPLKMDALRRVAIPSYAPEVSHVLTVELEFESGIKSRDDVALGGGAGEEARSELTAVPIRLAERRRLEPSAFSGTLRARGKILRVVEAEEGGATLWVVRDDSAVEANGRLRNLEGSPIRFPPLVSTTLALKKDDAVHFLWPRPQAFPNASVPTQLFPSTESFGHSDGGLAYLLSHVANPSPSSIFPMYADGVAVAGLNAFESFGRRAVLLVLGETSEDASTYGAGNVRRYLELLRVPLFVWTLRDVPPDFSPWGRMEAIGTSRGARTAYARLRASLESQRILWVEGRYLPQEIELAEGAEGIELVR